MSLLAELNDIIILSVVQIFCHFICIRANAKSEALKDLCISQSVRSLVSLTCRVGIYSP